MKRTGARAKAVGILICSLMLTVAWISGCSIATNPVARPAGCEDSVIYDTFPNPEVVDTLLVVAAFELAKQKPELCSILDEAFGYGEELLSKPGMTYIQFAAATAARFDWVNKYAGTELVILSELLAKFDRPIPMSECDRRLILAHLAKQRRTLALL